MSLRFILSNPDVSTTIIGMRKLHHVKENIAFSDAGPLDAESAAEIEGASLGSHARRSGLTEVGLCAHTVGDAAGSGVADMA